MTCKEFDQTVKEIAGEIERAGEFGVDCEASKSRGLDDPLRATIYLTARPGGWRFALPLIEAKEWAPGSDAVCILAPDPDLSGTILLLLEPENVFRVLARMAVLRLALMPDAADYGREVCFPGWVSNLVDGFPASSERLSEKEKGRGRG